MEQIDWSAMQTGGTPACWESLGRLEAGVCAMEAHLRELEARVVELKAGLRPGARLEVMWFRRYAELLLALLDGGLPEGLDAGEVGDWIRGRLGDASGGVNGDDGRIGNGTGCREVVEELGNGWRVEREEEGGV